MNQIFLKTKNHLKDSQKTYKEHLKGAFFYGLIMIFGGICSFIHGLFPFLLDGKTAKIIIDIYYDQLHNHPNLKYREYIKSKNH